ncbi:extracellular solute-binding protein [Caldibacillus lycopersici]|uniref:Extracellular solute-binding protein n=1 Tax=Perspicuibacillus lycopersici TaxID=1325689 RepID=A0AAE3IVS4_9BACI|nr:extracellular solute-binding protein [Perspicuibacillus lycopersici]MCU9615122.1 extracellular solute-binding protein [Perspicuibacillus lycopersici]
MKSSKKVLTYFLILLMAFFIVGCSSNSSKEEEVVGETTTVGPEDGAKLEMWLFVDLHQQFYTEMLNKWNEEHPDKQIQINFTVYPYADMHTKLTLAIQSGEGIPDMSDIEIGQFPNFLDGEVPWLPVNSYVEPYKADLVSSRLDAYAKDGNYYGVPTHVGAMVMYYNKEILEQYGIDYTQIKTWDDFTAAGEKLKEASNGEVFMTSVDTGGADWLTLAMSQYGESWVEDPENANVQLKSIENMLTMQQGWLESGIAEVTPGGQIDTEEGYATVANGEVAAFPKASWYMSRFTDYMPEMSGKIALAPIPVFEEGQARSNGVGGTGTVIYKESENAELAAEFMAWAKLSEEGGEKIWDILGFDPVNTKVWSNDVITHNPDNKFVQYFVNNPFDVFLEIQDEVNLIKTVPITTTINEAFNLTTLNEVLENGADVKEALAAAQEEVDFEQE